MPSMSARAVVGFLKLARNAKRVWTDPAEASGTCALATRPAASSPRRGGCAPT
jgi:2-phospho-L-lactate guanylyltransferase (CobY/MobA/RfbA family)